MPITFCHFAVRLLIAGMPPGDAEANETAGPVVAMTATNDVTETPWPMLLPRDRGPVARVLPVPPAMTSAVGLGVLWAAYRVGPLVRRRRGV